MHRFKAILDRTHIDIADLPPSVELNGLLVYVGQFPNGCGRIFLNPDIDIADDPRFAAVVAHELSHILLSACTAHPSSVLQLLLDPATRDIYNHHEEEADLLAAHLLVPPPLRAAYACPRQLAHALHVPLEVVERALAAPDYDPTPICAFLTALIGQPYFVPRELGIAA